MSKFNLSKVDIIRAWKDEGYRMSLSAAQRAALPANPAGSMELEDAQLDAVAAGAGDGTGTGTGSSGSGTGTNCCKPK